MSAQAVPSQRTRRLPRRWTFQRVLMVFIAAFGCGILLYPTAANWFSDRSHASEIDSYVEKSQSLGSAETQKIMAAARNYNDKLPSGPLRDPYALNEDGQRISVGSGSEAYRSTLDVGLDGMMGQISIPSINVSLPIFHGTSEETLAKGAGHIFGSSLPIGGTGTHSVITAHSGLINAVLFNDLKKVHIGDVFTATVLDESISYRVVSTKTVLPNETQELRQVPGKDYLTLITCTPTGVNSHRLLVRGERIDTPTVPWEAVESIENPVKDPGFPWWALVFTGATAGAVIVTKPRKSLHARQRHAA